MEGLAHKGNILFTFAQTNFDQNHDYIERDENGKLLGMWADFYSEPNLPSLKPTEPDPTLSGNYAVITHSGKESHIKVNGSYKSITITYYNANELIDDQTPGDWSYWIDDTDVSGLVTVLETSSPNTIKVKFVGDETYLGRVLTIKNTRNTLVAELQLQIVSL